VRQDVGLVVLAEVSDGIGPHLARAAEPGDEDHRPAVARHLDAERDRLEVLGRGKWVAIAPGMIALLGLALGGPGGAARR